jgi:hypothetical protein
MRFVIIFLEIKTIHSITQPFSEIWQYCDCMTFEPLLESFRCNLLILFTVEELVSVASDNELPI